MTEAETLEALAAIGLRGEPCGTGHADYRRIFIIDGHGISQGRITIYCGQYHHVKWYVEGALGEGILPDERLPWAWRLWLERRQRLDVARWNMTVQRAEQLAHAERAAKQAWRDANRKPGKRPRLALKTRSYVTKLLLE